MGKDNGVTKLILEAGDIRGEKPPPLSCASVHVRGTLQSSGHVFLDRTHEEYECILGRGMLLYNQPGFAGDVHARVRPVCTRSRDGIVDNVHQ